jgi:hypothetical protein
MTVKPETNLVEPLDFLILDLLPPEGTTAFGVYPDGQTAASLSKQIGEGRLKTSTFSTRLRVLKLMDYTTSKRGISGATKGQVWQRTEAGEKALHRWKADHGDE